jgi:hypothetical protein
MTRYNTLLLDRTVWDLVIDSAGNIAMAEPEYALAQDVASAIKLFLGELWFDTAKGIPYWENVLGQLPPVSLIIGYMENAAKTVPGVVSAKCTITSFGERNLTGQVLFIDETGITNAVNF